MMSLESARMLTEPAELGLARITTVAIPDSSREEKYNNKDVYDFKQTEEHMEREREFTSVRD